MGMGQSGKKGWVWSHQNGSLDEDSKGTKLDRAVKRPQGGKGVDDGFYSGQQTTNSTARVWFRTTK